MRLTALMCPTQDVVVIPTLLRNDIVWVRNIVSVDPNKRLRRRVAVASDCVPQCLNAMC